MEGDIYGFPLARWISICKWIRIVEEENIKC